MIEGLNEAYDVASVPTGDITFSITSNVPWSISQKDLDWVTITPSRGLGEKELVVVTITPAVNSALEPREGSFTLTAGTVTKNCFPPYTGACSGERTMACISWSAGL